MSNEWENMPIPESAKPSEFRDRERERKQRQAQLAAFVPSGTFLARLGMNVGITDDRVILYRNRDVEGTAVYQLEQGIAKVVAGETATLTAENERLRKDLAEYRKG